MNVSALVVEIKECKPYIEILKDSIARYNSCVKEIIIAVTDVSPKEDFYDVSFYKGMKILRFAAGIKDHKHGHGMGLNAALRHAQSDYILFTDPDVFWYSDVASYWIGLMQKYDLNYIGVCHHNALGQCFKFFPYVFHSIVKRKTLPDENWLKGKLIQRPWLMRHEVENLVPDENWIRSDGCYLIPSPIKETYDLYPNKNREAIYDTGCNLWLWNEEKKGKWMSFQTIDCHNYTTGYSRNNFGCKDILEKKKLIYHKCSCTKAEPDYFSKYQEIYRNCI